MFAALLAQTQVETAKEVVDAASRASDRWLFLAAVVIILLSGATIIRYLVSTLDGQRDTHAKATREQQDAHNVAMAKQQDAHAQFMREVYSENVRVQAQLLVALQENNVLLVRIQKLLEKIEEKH